jgi:hypothetical protein
MKQNLKKAVERIETFRDAWDKNAASTPLIGITLEEFTEATKAPCVAKAESEALRKEAKRQYVNGLNALPQVLPLLERLVFAVQANPDFGPDSAFYQELGYIRKSDRKKGLTRKGTAPPDGDTGQAVENSPSTDAK